MKYIMKAGVLYKEDQMIALIKVNNSLVGPEKRIILLEKEEMWKTNILLKSPDSGNIADVRFREYILTNQREEAVAVGCPDYAREEDPTVNGWPAFHVPKVDHSKVVIDREEYILIMQDSQNYAMKNSVGEEVLRIIHRGLTGGWMIEETLGINPEVLCGLYLFCRYMEQENELLMV